MSPQPLASDLLADAPHGFFTRQGGVSQNLYASLNCGARGTGDTVAAVDENRGRVAGWIGVEPGMLLTLNQVHGIEAVTVTQPWNADAPPAADAMVTALPGLALGILTADCVPVLFTSRDGRIVGAAHAGWRGALGGVVESTLRAMAALGAAPAEIIACIGPCIAQASYQVGEEVGAAFRAADSGNGQFFAADAAGRLRFDLPGFVLFRLRAAGVGACAALPHDTYADPDRFFSYRRTTHAGESGYGRQISVIATTS